MSNAASASDKVTVIDVTQYGADPTGVKDSAEGIQAAIEAAKEVNGPVVLDFPKGEYQIYPDHAQKRELYPAMRNGLKDEHTTVRSAIFDALEICDTYIGFEEDAQ